MKYERTQVKKVCGLYVDEWHLTTMILPYIVKQANQNKKIITILEEGIKTKIEEILSRMNLKEETNKKVLQIDWTSKKTCKYGEIKDQIQEAKQDIEIIIKGTDEYIEKVNKAIEKAINKAETKNITIVNLYDASKHKEDQEIRKKHEYTINTAGIKKIEEKNEDNKNIV